jgi:hypothetical protein
MNLSDFDLFSRAACSYLGLGISAISFSTHLLERGTHLVDRHGRLTLGNAVLDTANDRVATSTSIFLSMKSVADLETDRVAQLAFFGAWCPARQRCRSARAANSAALKANTHS